MGKWIEEEGVVENGPTGEDGRRGVYRGGWLRYRQYLNDLIGGRARHTSSLKR